MIRLATLTTLGILFLAVVGWRQALRVHDFSSLPRGNVLKVHYYSSGCFNQDEYEFTFRRDRDLTVNALENAKSPSKYYGGKTLSKDEVGKLDALLNFYRHVKRGGCTTVDTVTFTEYHGSKVVATESYRDATCSTYDNDSLLTFGELETLIMHANDEAP